MHTTAWTNANAGRINATHFHAHKREQNVVRYPDKHCPEACEGEHGAFCLGMNRLAKEQKAQAPQANHRPCSESLDYVLAIQTMWHDCVLGHTTWPTYCKQRKRSKKIKKKWRGESTTAQNQKQKKHCLPRSNLIRNTPSDKEHADRLTKTTTYAGSKSFPRDGGR